MTRYLLLIHDDDRALAAMGDEERTSYLAGYGALYADMRAAGHAVDGDGLAPATDAVVVRRRDGRVLRTDGPYAETKEQVGGYFLVDCDLETAVAYAARIPAASTGTIEVRAVGTE
jgi:hypothetical protein